MGGHLIALRSALMVFFVMPRWHVACINLGGINSFNIVALYNRWTLYWKVIKLGHY